MIAYILRSKIRRCEKQGMVSFELYRCWQWSLCISSTPENKYRHLECRESLKSHIYIYIYMCVCVCVCFHLQQSDPIKSIQFPKGIVSHTLRALLSFYMTSFVTPQHVQSKASKFWTRLCEQWLQSKATWNKGFQTAEQLHCDTLATRRSLFKYSVLLGTGVAQYIYRLITDWMTGVRSPAEGKDFYSSLFPDQFWGPPNLLYSGTGGSFPGVRRGGAWRWTLTPSRAEIKNE
jgi:hypothetical protein